MRKWSSIGQTKDEIWIMFFSREMGGRREEDKEKGSKAGFNINRDLWKVEMDW